MRKIKPGLIADLPNADYHAGPGVSKSQLDLVAKCPGLLAWSAKAPRDDEARAAVDIGTALHALLLEPDKFADGYAVEFAPPETALVTIDQLKAYMDANGIEYAAKDSKGALTEKLLAAAPDAPVIERLRALHAHETRGRVILSEAEFRKLHLMRDSVLAHPFARALVQSPGLVEPSIYWRDPDTKVLCRMRPDKIANLRNGRRFLLDVKTTADMDRFAASVHDYRYHVQDAFYSEGFERHFGAPPDAFVFLAVSTTRDAGRYPVRCFVLDPEDRQAGADAWRANLATYAACVAADSWPGIESISRPDWARRREAAQQ